MLLDSENAKLLTAALIYYKSFIKKTRTADSHEFDKENIEKCDKLIKEFDEHIAWREQAGLK
jgi:hypothetical protein